MSATTVKETLSFALPTVESLNESLSVALVSLKSLSAARAPDRRIRRLRQERQRASPAGRRLAGADGGPEVGGVGLKALQLQRLGRLYPGKGYGRAGGLCTV